MKIAAFALSAAVLAATSITPASALTPSGVGHASVQPGSAIPVVQKKVVVTKKNGVVTKTVVHTNKFRPGGHYKHAPNGWHRHDKRPGDWHARGCVVVGPIWYCP